MADPVAPSASCVQAHAQQIANNRILVLQNQLAATRAELGFVQAQESLQTAEAAYDKSFSLGERLSAWSGVAGVIGYGADAANVRAQLVEPRQQTVRNFAIEAARQHAGAKEIARITDELEARGPERQGECTPVRPLPGALPPSSDVPTHIPPAGRTLKPGEREA